MTISIRNREGGAAEKFVSQPRVSSAADDCGSRRGHCHHPNFLPEFLRANLRPISTSLKRGSAELNVMPSAGGASPFVDDPAVCGSLCISPRLRSGRLARSTFPIRRSVAPTLIAVSRVRAQKRWTRLSVLIGIFLLIAASWGGNSGRCECRFFGPALMQPKWHIRS